MRTKVSLCSLLLEVLELGLRLLLRGRDVALGVDVDQPGLLHLREDLLVLLELLVELVVSAKLVLDHLDLVEFFLDIGLAVGLRLLSFLYLLLGAPSLARLLEHVRGDALGVCTDNIMRQRWEVEGTYRRRGWLISGAPRSLGRWQCSGSSRRPSCHFAG